MTNLGPAAIISPFIIFLILLIPEFTAYNNYQTNMTTVAKYAIDLAEKHGGFYYQLSDGTTVDIRPLIESKMEELNLSGEVYQSERSDLYQVAYRHTNMNVPERVDFNGDLEFTIRGLYRFRAFQILDNITFGSETSNVGNVGIVPIQITKTGVSQVAFR